ncbi:JmjC domain-containing protein [Piscinibacter terrae]|uniref:Cupin domain-containing protein n=1 Tax=Piscinibacter terrae TaxID=2496871 RepID=A0A3N7HRR4_9BURK|nr:cupin domain-containing protein [Albitalea terrae]RQP23896.1 cupin domain-containing protein [Albitalea terrae]
MDVSLASPLLGGLTPQVFMRRHWQKQPLLIRQAIPGIVPPVARNDLFAMAASDEVESRLVQLKDGQWSMKQGPIARRQLPTVKTNAWTLLVQGVDLHVPAAHELLSRFRFVPDARLDDLMMSYATDGGGVGPHFDSYDVFLLQVHGKRRWRIGRMNDAALVPGLPLKILSNFQPEEEWVLEPGDMLYLPPRWAHDGVAEGECMTCSIGFRAPARDEVGREVLQRLLDGEEPAAQPTLYRDPSQPATDAPGRIPSTLLEFTKEAVAKLAENQKALAVSLGEWLSEPKPIVAFDDGDELRPEADIALDRRTRMLYDDEHVFINGESYRAAGQDAMLMRQLSDQRRLTASQWAKASDEARQLIAEWAEAGWLHSQGDEEHDQ